MLKAVLKKNDKSAHALIWVVSVVIFIAVLILGRVKLEANLGFDVHLFALFNAVINSLVSVSLIAGMIAVKQKRYLLHKKIMLGSIGLSVVFLLSYICHHLLSGSTEYGGEGTIKYIYYIILVTHIFLAGIILPFILYTAYRALSGEFSRHKKLARITWPIWLYVSVTGVLVYLMISPYY